MASRTALVAGATGLVGSRCLDRLLQTPDYGSVRALVRRPLQRVDPKLSAVLTDYDDLNALGDTLATDDVYCCLGTTMRKAGSEEAFERVDVDLPAELARVTRARGARQFLLVSSLGAAPDARTFYLRAKARAEARVADAGFPALLIFRPSLLLGSRNETRPLETVGQVVARLVAPLLVGRFRRYRAVRAETVARAMIRAALAGHRGGNLFESERIQQLSAAPGGP